MDLLMDTYTMDVSPLNSSAKNMTSYSFNAKQYAMLNHHDHALIIAPAMSWRQPAYDSASTTTPHHDHGLLSTDTHLHLQDRPDQPDIAPPNIDLHALLAPHLQQTATTPPSLRMHYTMLSSNMSSNSIDDEVPSHACIDYASGIDLSNAIDNLSNGEDLLNFGMSNNLESTSFPHEIAPSRSTNIPTSTSMRQPENVNIDIMNADDDAGSHRRVHYDPHMAELYDADHHYHHHQQPDQQQQTARKDNYYNSSPTTSSIFNGVMDMSSLITAAGQNNNSNNTNTNHDHMVEDDHGGNMNDMLLLVNNGINGDMDPIICGNSDNNIFNTNTNIVDPTCLSLGKYPNGITRNVISGDNYPSLMQEGMRLGHTAASYNNMVGANGQDNAGSISNSSRDVVFSHTHMHGYGQAGMGQGADGGHDDHESILLSTGFNKSRSSTISFGEPDPPISIADADDINMIFKDYSAALTSRISRSRSRRSSSSTSPSSSIISTSTKTSDQLSSSNATCIDYATVASLLTPIYSARPKKSSRHPLGPALNTNLKPRARQGCASDPQSMAARQRRERINKRLKALQELVPNGSKVDLVTMLEKAINYVKFLQLQLKVLTDDEFWSNPQNLIQFNTDDHSISEEKYIDQHGIPPPPTSAPKLMTNLVPRVA